MIAFFTEQWFSSRQIGSRTLLKALPNPGNPQTYQSTTATLPPSHEEIEGFISKQRMEMIRSDEN
jgi:hypothetical protein